MLYRCHDGCYITTCDTRHQRGECLADRGGDADSFAARHRQEWRYASLRASKLARETAVVCARRRAGSARLAVYVILALSAWSFGARCEQRALHLAERVQRVLVAAKSEVRNFCDKGVQCGRARSRARRRRLPKVCGVGVFFMGAESGSRLLLDVQTNVSVPAAGGQCPMNVCTFAFVWTSSGEPELRCERYFTPITHK